MPARTSLHDSRAASPARLQASPPAASPSWAGTDGSDLFSASPPAGRKPDAESTRRDIIEIATEEFAKKGYNGARIDEIAARTKTSKRMLYYYFRDKEGLFIAVLEEAYRRIREMEASLAVDHLEPEAAMRALVSVTFDQHILNEDFVRLVMVENIHRGEHVDKSRAIQDLNIPIIDTTRRIYQRGVEAGVFRPGLDPIDIHMTASALAFHMVANRSTFSRIFKRDMASVEAIAKRREVVIDTVVRYLRTEPSRNRYGSETAHRA